MIFALVNGERANAQPKGRGECPSCGQPVVAKCGRIKIWHWAHATNDCDIWSEGLTAWHLDWQNRFPGEWQEVNIARGDRSHRADIYTPSGIVVEFQHSYLGAEEISLREKFYGPLMRWVFDAREAYNSGRLSFSYRGTDATWVKFRWKYPRTSICFARRPVYLDIGEGLLLQIRKLSASPPSGGWGHITNHRAFANRIQEASCNATDFQ